MGPPQYWTIYMSDLFCPLVLTQHMIGCVVRPGKHTYIWTKLLSVPSSYGRAWPLSSRKVRDKYERLPYYRLPRLPRLPLPRVAEQCRSWCSPLTPLIYMRRPYCFARKCQTRTINASVYYLRTFANYISRNSDLIK